MGSSAPNWLQFVGLVFDFAGFGILFLNSKKSLRKIEPNNILPRIGGLMGGRSATQEIGKIAERIIEKVNRAFTELIKQINDHSFYTKLSWFLITVGFFLQGIGMAMQLFP